MVGMEIRAWTWKGGRHSDKAHLRGVSEPFRVPSAGRDSSPSSSSSSFFSIAFTWDDLTLFRPRGPRGAAQDVRPPPPSSFQSGQIGALGSRRGRLNIAPNLATLPTLLLLLLSPRSFHFFLISFGGFSFLFFFPARLLLSLSVSFWTAS